MSRKDREKLTPTQFLNTVVRSAQKRAYQWLAINRNTPKRIAFIFGCQRSGTTMLTRCLRRDPRTKVYGENGLANKSLRLLPYDEIAQIIGRERATLLVAKPIVESQHAVKLLDYFSESRAIWMYRDYRDVADSSLRRFGAESTFRNLRPIVQPLGQDPHNPHKIGSADDSYSWASEGVSQQTREIVARYFADDMPVYDAKALFWYVRNVLFFEQGLDQSPRTMLCKYSEIVSDPVQVMQGIYSFLQVEYPGNYIVDNIHRRSVGVGDGISISPEIEHLCDDLSKRLDETRVSQSKGQ